MSQEIKIDGIAIAPDVLTTIVVRSLADIEGVASVGNNDLAANLVSMFSSKTSSPSLPAVEATVEDDALHIVVRLTVFLAIRLKSSPRLCASPFQGD